MNPAVKDCKRVALVAAHFVPSNLASVHRSRLWSLHLREFGWEPVIVTTHWDYYEEKNEPGLASLLPPDLRIVRTKAFRTKPIRWVGDIGIRAFPWHYRALVGLARAREIDFLHITIPPNYSALLGRLVKRKTGLPYGIDFIDPWAGVRPVTPPRPFTKAWCSTRLADLLEPWAVAKASLITGINRPYIQGMLDRNPRVAQEAVLAEMPYGGSEKDHEYARLHPGPATLFADHAGKFNLIYAGTMWGPAFPVRDCLLDGIVQLRQKRPRLAAEFHLHFVGTGKSPDDPQGFNIRPEIEKRGLQDCVSEYPQRRSYLDVLTHLHAASGVLVLGSIEPHYSPSKIFQSVMSRRPVFAMLHEQSTAVPIFRATNAGCCVTLSENALPPAATLASELERFIYANDYSEARVRWDALEEHSARESARILARALDEVLARGNNEQIN